MRRRAVGRLLPGRGLTDDATPPRPRLVERYREFLPVTDATPVVSLGEGATPLVHARRLGATIGVPDLYLKIEGQNPTGSFKDRGMVMAIAKALESGARCVICASTGNTSASAAAYAAAAGLECVVVLPAGKIAIGKLLQALVFGARVIAVRGNFDEALHVVRALSEQDDHPITLVNSVNPFRLEGQKTAAFEVVDDLGRAPDILAIPVGNAGNITAYWRGFREYRDAGRAASTPRMWGFQAAGAAPLVVGHPIEHPETIATAIRIGNPASWSLPPPPATTPAGASTRSPTTRSSPPTGSSPASRACSASRRPPRRSRASSRRPAPVRSTRRHGRLRADRQRPQGPHDRRGRPRGRGDRGRADDRRRGHALGWADAAVDRARRVAGAGDWASVVGRRLVVDVPASTANLGAGYDCLGLALELFNRVTVEAVEGDGAIELVTTGEGAGELGGERSNRFVMGLEAALEAQLGPRPIASAGGSPRTTGSRCRAAWARRPRPPSAAWGRQRARRRDAVDARAAADGDRHRGAPGQRGGRAAGRVRRLGASRPAGGGRALRRPGGLLARACSSPTAGCPPPTCAGCCRPRCRCATPCRT